MKAIERHRQVWPGRSDEWLFERLNSELQQKVSEIHKLLDENNKLKQLHSSSENEHFFAFIDEQYSHSSENYRKELKNKFLEWKQRNLQ